MTLSDTLKWGENYLTEKGIEESRLNAWYLFSHCFQMERSQFFLHSDDEAEKEKRAIFEDLVEKRGKHMPLEHLTHHTEFMGLPFFVDENVLIPRQDTECLVEEVLKVCQGKEVLDMCTGSGCIGISLAKMGHCNSVTLADISEKALSVAERNAKENDVEVSICHSDLFENIQGEFDIIVSNPPYIATAEIDNLMLEVRDYEPKLALDGSGDGLLFYRSIVVESRTFLRQGGELFFEIGYDQGTAVKKEMEAAGFELVQIKKDLAGLDRIVQGRLA